jgi:pimeloyl-ACP methyl ester carboxylesterase
VDKRCSYRSVDLFYRVEGTGRPVVLVHGFAEDHTIWAEQVNELKKKYRVILPDLPGSGNSPYNRQLSSIDDLADAIRALAGNDQLDHMILIGHSMGGYITLAFAEKYPDLLSAIGLFHSTAFPDSEEKKAARRKSIEFIRQYGSAPFIGQSVPNLFSDLFKKKFPAAVSALVDRYTRFDQRALIQYYEAMMARPDRTQVLNEFRSPVLFIIGEQDKAVPLEDSLRQCHIPDSSHIHILPNAAHMGMLEEAASSTRHLADFAAYAG